MTWTRRSFLAYSSAVGVLALSTPALATDGTSHPLLADATLRDLLVAHGTPRYAQFHVMTRGMFHVNAETLSTSVLTTAHAYDQLVSEPTSLDSLVLQHDGRAGNMSEHLVLTLRYKSGNMVVISGNTAGDTSQRDVLRFAGGTLELARGGRDHRWISPVGAVSLPVRRMPAPPLRVAVPIEEAFARALA